MKFKKLLIFSLIILFAGGFLAAGFIIARPFFNTQNKTENNQQNQSNQSFSFIVAGDSHNDLEKYQQIIEGANSDNANKVLIDLGDITRVGGESEYRNFKNNLASLKVPYHIVLGNHDIVGNGLDYYQKYFGKTDESFDLEDSHFVILDDVTNPNAFSDEQLTWLENDLANSNKTLKFVFTHTPVQCPFVNKSELGFTGSGADQQITKFIEILKKYNVNQIFSGHIHNHLNYSVDGIPQVVTGGAGGPLYNIPLFGKNFYHYLKVDVLGGNFSAKVVELN